MKSKNLKKMELVMEVAKISETTKAVAEKCVNAFITTVENALCNKQAITLVGFGSFSVSQRKARNGRNPQTGAVIKIPATNVVRFKVGKTLKEKVKK